MKFLKLIARIFTRRTVPCECGGAIPMYGGWVETGYCYCNTCGHAITEEDYFRRLGVKSRC